MQDRLHQALLAAKPARSSKAETMAPWASCRERDAQPSAVPTPATTYTIAGDLKPLDHDPDAAGIQEDYDSFGNVIVGSEVAANREDTLYDSAGNDHLLGHGGNDTLYAWRGGDDLLEGGAGQDYLSGGAGNDNLYGDKQGNANIDWPLTRQATTSGLQITYFSDMQSQRAYKVRKAA